jgi:antitoxin (DNA-binding transcriptional repressor) of toxin-antitoxin stability system
MRFITVRDFRSRPAKVWRDLRNADEMILTSNGKPIALLTSVSEDTLEDTLHVVRKAKAMAAVFSIQTDSVTKGKDKLSLEEINKEIQAVRRGRS